MTAGWWTKVPQQHLTNGKVSEAQQHLANNAKPRRWFAINDPMHRGVGWQLDNDEWHDDIDRSREARVLLEGALCPEHSARCQRTSHKNRAVSI